MVGQSRGSFSLGLPRERAGLVRTALTFIRARSLLTEHGHTRQKHTCTRTHTDVCTVQTSSSRKSWTGCPRRALGEAHQGCPHARAPPLPGLSHLPPGLPPPSEPPHPRPLPLFVTGLAGTRHGLLLRARFADGGGSGRQGAYEAGYRAWRETPAELHPGSCLHSRGPLEQPWISLRPTSPPRTQPTPNLQAKLPPFSPGCGRPHPKPLALRPCKLPVPKPLPPGHAGPTQLCPLSSTVVHNVGMSHQHFKISKSTEKPVSPAALRNLQNLATQDTRLLMAMRLAAAPPGRGTWSSPPTASRCLPKGPSPQGPITLNPAVAPGDPSGFGRFSK